MLLDGVPARCHIGVVAEGCADFEMIAPAGDFDACIGKGFGFRAKSVKGEIGPLAAKEGN